MQGEFVGSVKNGFGGFFRRLIAGLLMLMIIFPLSLGFMEEPSLNESLRPWSKKDGYCYVSFGEYPFSENGEKKVIAWRVLSLEDNKLYLFSEYILDVKKLNENHPLRKEKEHRKPYEGWLKSDCYKWLNEEFIVKAFSDEEIACLYPHEEGRVSLASSDDLKNKKFGFEQKKSRFSFGTPYAYKQGPVGLYVYSGSKSSPIWTRTRSKQKHAQCTTKLDGAIGYATVSWKDIGVRPVIWVLLDNIKISGGSGILESPYVLEPIGKKD